MSRSDRNRHDAPPRARDGQAGFAPPFHPPWWLRSPHAQTIAGKFLRRDPGLELRRERIETPDGDFIDLDFASFADSPRPGPTPPGGRTSGERVPADAPTVLVLHGLEGSARRNYMLLTYRELLRLGLRPVGLNFRSCSGEPNRLPRFYHSGETDDLRLALDYLARHSPGGIRGAIGFSLGGNVLLKYLGEESDEARRRLDAAVAISVPFDLAAGAATLERGVMGRIYTEYFLRSLRAKIQAKLGIMPPGIDAAAALRARTLRAFDDAVTAPLHGFADAADYYHRSSSARYLEAIRVPTLLIHAEDDPFLPPPAIPRRVIAQNSYLTPAISRRGGHVGFLSGTPRTPTYHAETTAAHFLR